VAAASHAIEDRLGEEPLDPADLESLALLWRRFCERLSMVIDTRAGIIEIHQADYAALRNAVRTAASHSVLDRMVAELRYEPVAVALGRGAAQARALARRLHKGEITVEIEACDIRLDPNRWKSLWSACDHAIRNAVDHGLEDATEREARGKSREGRLRFSARLAADDLVITIEDDGRGVDWARVEQRARVVGLPHQTRADLADALFFEGLSTRDEATQVSGRGIGLNALRQAVLSLGGQIEIDSRPGEGTILRMRFPNAARWSAPPRTEQAFVAA
jgi:two-component system chemotaxis sensor kinase CheA